MKSIVFDTGPIISLTLNNLLWTLAPLKKRFKGKFYITSAVKGELIDYPLQTKKFKFEAFQVLKAIKEGTLEVIDTPFIQKKTPELLEIANNIYSIKGAPLRMFHYAEMSALAAAIEIGASAVVVDEQMTRIVLENPKRIEELLKKRMHSTPKSDRQKLASLQSQLKDITILRSTELVTLAYEFGTFEDFIPDASIVKNPRQTLLEGLLWGLKLNGAAISEHEIEKILAIEKPK